jgi:hypothetical protein
LKLPQRLTGMRKEGSWLPVKFVEELLIGNIVLVDPSPLLLSATPDKSGDPLETPFTEFYVSRSTVLRIN